jgi:hypothetical protein
MKSGTGDDPFADEIEEEPDEEEQTDDDLDLDTAESGDQENETDPTPSEKTEGAQTSTENTETEGSSDKIDSQDIPWVLRRDGVKDDRPNMTQFFLRDTTDQAERGFQQDVENILNKDVYLLDLREAAYQVAMEHPDEVADVLEEWGYDYL